MRRAYSNDMHDVIVLYDSGSAACKICADAVASLLAGLAAPPGNVTICGYGAQVHIRA